MSENKEEENCFYRKACLCSCPLLLFRQDIGLTSTLYFWEILLVNDFLNGPENYTK